MTLVTLICLAGSVAPVPLPAAAWLLIAAIGGIGALKLRRARG